MRLAESAGGANELPDLIAIMGAYLYKGMEKREENKRE